VQGPKSIAAEQWICHFESALHSAVSGHDNAPYPGQLIPGVGQAAPSLGSELASGQLSALAAPALLAPALLVPASLVELPSPRDFPAQATASKTNEIQPNVFITPWPHSTCEHIAGPAGME